MWANSIVGEIFTMNEYSEDIAESVSALPRPRALLPQVCLSNEDVGQRIFPSHSQSLARQSLWRMTTFLPRDGSHDSVETSRTY